jgi:hypothetical protein
MEHNFILFEKKTISSIWSGLTFKLFVPSRISWHSRSFGLTKQLEIIVVCP